MGHDKFALVRIVDFTRKKVASPEGILFNDAHNLPVECETASRTLRPVAGTLGQRPRFPRLPHPFPTPL